MKKLIYILPAFFAGLFTSQVGINTITPINALDINTDLNVREEIRVGGTNTTNGYAGTAGLIFHNDASLNTNDWKDIKIADGQGSMALYSINTVSDQTGVVFEFPSGFSVPYTENSPIDDAWVVLPGTVSTFSITNPINKVNFNFQTTAQKSGNYILLSYGCGVFVDDLLKAVRTDVIFGAEGTYKIFNLNTTLSNLPQKNNYNVKVACRKRSMANPGNFLGIGTAVNPTYLNSDMAQSVLTTIVLQPY